MKFAICTNCQAPNEVPLHYLGREVRCSSCDKSFLAVDSGAATNHQTTDSSTPTKTKKEQPGCLGCSMFLAIPIGLWGLYAFFSALGGYSIESVKTSRELKINSDYEMQSKGKQRAEFERVSHKVTETADGEQRVFSAVIGLAMIGGAFGLVKLAGKIDRTK